MVKWVTLPWVLGYVQVRSEDNNGVTGEHYLCLRCRQADDSTARKHEHFLVLKLYTL